MEHISITKDNLKQPRNWFWAKVLTIAVVLCLSMFLITRYIYQQGFVRGFKKGYLDAYMVDSCLGFDQEVHRVVGTKAAD